MTDDLVPTEQLLTSLELKVAEQLRTGATNKEIARRLNLSPFTVREYVQRLATKLKCRNRVDIAVALIGRHLPTSVGLQRKQTKP